MNHGCSRMSMGFGKTIQIAIGIEGPFPSCFQARTGGARGVWIGQGSLD
jgi:RNA dependent RNA polymerase.